MFYSPCAALPHILCHLILFSQPHRNFLERNQVSNLAFSGITHRSLSTVLLTQWVLKTCLVIVMSHIAFRWWFKSIVPLRNKEFGWCLLGNRWWSGSEGKLQTVLPLNIYTLSFSKLVCSLSLKLRQCNECRCTFSRIHAALEPLEIISTQIRLDGMKTGRKSANVTFFKRENSPKPTPFSAPFILQLGVPSGKKLGAPSQGKLSSLGDKCSDTDQMVGGGRSPFPPPSVQSTSQQAPCMITHVYY